jgi:hypothetical protein
MNKKLLATTAIASLGVAFSAAAEVKLSGNIEYVMQAISSNEVTAGSSDDFEGIESNIKFNASKDTDLGALSYGFGLENGSEEGAHIKLDNDNLVVHVGSDSFQNLSATVVPNTGEAWQTVLGNTGALAYESSFDLGAATTKNAFGYAVGAKVAGGTLSARYTNDTSSGNGAGAAAAGTGGSSNTIMYSGSLGVDGLSVLVGRTTIESADGNTVDGEGDSIGIAYNMGQFTFGVAKKDFEDSAATAAAQDEFNTKEFGIGYAVNDNMTIAVNYIETDGDNAGTDFASDEEIWGVGIGYNLGGIALEVSYAEVENVGGTTNADAEALQIRTVQKF